MRPVRLLFTLSFVFCCWLSSFAQCTIRDSVSYQSLGSGRYHLTAHPTGGTRIAYIWFQGSSPLSFFSDTFTFTFTAGPQSVVSEVYDSATLCYAVDTVHFTVPCSVFSAHISDTVLGGGRYQQAVASGGSGTYSYAWSDTTYNSEYVNVTFHSGTNCVTVTDSHSGCTASACQNTCHITDSISYAIQSNGQYLYTAHQSGAARPSYSWSTSSNGFEVSQSGNTSLFIMASPGVQYIVCSIQDSANAGCSHTDTLSIPMRCRLSVDIRDSIGGGPVSGGMVPILVAHVEDTATTSYTYQWSDGSTGPRIFDPILGVAYCVTITDQFGCIATQCDTPCSFPATVRDSIAGSSNIFTLVPTSGSLSWILWGNGVSFGNPYTVSSTAGTIPLIATNTQGCYFIDTLTAHPCTLSSSLSYTHTPGNNYTFTASPSSGAAPYSYRWTIDNYALPFTTATVTDSLPAGYYFVCVQITDANSCITSSCDTFTVGTPVNCNITVRVIDTASGGTPYVYAPIVDAGSTVYTYQWSTGNTGPVIFNTTGTGYCVTVTDGLGCVASSCDTSCTLSGYASHTVSGAGWTQLATAISGIAPYQYQWSSGDTTATFYTAQHGIYYVTITDAHGCTHVAQDTLGSPCYLVATLSLSSYYQGTAVLIDVSAYNNNGPLSYIWPSGGSPYGSGDTVFASGTYCVTVHDSSGCAVTVCDTVHVGCNMHLSLYDSVSVGYHTLFVQSVSGAQAPLTYSWSDNTHAPVLIQHVNGTYCLTVTDAYGCTAAACDTIHLPCTLRAHVVDSSYGSYHILYATPDSGATPYAYQWTNISGGVLSTAPYYYATQNMSYCLSVSDTNGCLAGYCDSVILGCHISASYTYTHTAANSYTFATTSTGGTAPLRYNWGVDNQNAVLTTTPAYTITLTQGTHTVCVNTYDANNCYDSICQSVVVAAPSGCNISASYTYTHTAADLYTFATTSTGGTAPLRYNWGVDNQSAVLTTVPLYIITLTQGTHTVCVNTYDANNCHDSICQSVVVPAPVICTMTAYINSYNNVTSQILVAHSLNAHGSTQILWSNNATTGAITAATSGSYCVTLTDSLGCTATACDTVHLIPLSDTICGTIFYDRNLNGVADAGEPGVPGQYVMIYQGSTYVESIYADSSGHYRGAVPSGPITITYWSPGIDAVTVPLGPEASIGIVSYDTVSIYGTQCGFNFGVVDSSITISGYVYFDANGNGVKDAGEAGIPNQLVYVGPHWVYTDQNGFYIYTGDVGQYTASYSPSATYSSYTVYPSTHTVNATTIGNVYAGNNFGLSSNTTACNISVLMIAHTTVTAGFPAWYDVYVENHGNNTASGTMTFYYDPSLTFDYANPAQASVNTTNHYITFNYSGLQPGQYKDISLNFNASNTVTVGQSTFEMATATDNCIESNFNDNTDTLHQTATGSWDPNSKIVTPSGEGAQGLIHRDQLLRYSINFQNTGTSPAVNVVLKDSIPASLDMSTLRILGASHPRYAVKVEGHMLTCQFSQIMLPDSAADEQGSHGYLAFAISPDAGVADGTQIQNTAAIYFDYNAAVVTNTTLNTIDYALSIADLQNHATITVSPNPFSDYTTIRVTGADIHGAALDVYNDLGQIVTTSTPAADGTFSISRGTLSSGIYTYHISHAGSLIGSGKLVIE